MAYKKRDCCASCGSEDLVNIMDYGKVPLAGYFPDKIEEVDHHQYDMQLQFCQSCYLVQTDSIIDADTLFKDYRYMSSIGLSKHFADVAQMLVDRFHPNNVLEIGSNDGVLLKPLQQLGVGAIGVDPATNVVEVARQNGCQVYDDYFSDKFVIKNNFQGQFPMVIANNCFAHIDDIHSIIKGAKLALIPIDGRMVIEVHYVQDLIDKSQYETVYHEHLYYYSVNSLSRLFDSYGMSIESVERIPIHGGSIRVIVKNQHSVTSPEVLEMLAKEVKDGLTSVDHFLQFGQQSTDHINRVKQLVSSLKADGARIVGYGASGRGNIFCKLCDFNPSQIDYIVDESPERIGRYTPSTSIPIVSKQTLDEDQPDYVFIFAWNYSKMIINKLQDRGFKFIIAFPEPIIVDNGDSLDPSIFI